MQPTLFSLLAIHLFRSLIRGLIETNSSRLRQSSFLHVQDQSDIVVCQLRWDSFLRIWRQRVNVENSVERRTTKRSCHDWFARNQEPVNRKRSATHHFGEVHDSGRVIERGDRKDHSVLYHASVILPPPASRRWDDWIVKTFLALAHNKNSFSGDPVGLHGEGNVTMALLRRLLFTWQYQMKEETIGCSNPITSPFKEFFMYGSPKSNE